MEISAKLKVIHEIGLHARPASLFVQTASRFTSDIQITNCATGKGPVNAKSILSVLTLGIGKGNEMLISAKGDDADKALQTLTELIDSNFGEETN